MAADPYKYFRLEARELIDELSRAALALEKAASVDALARLLRHAHTLKGAARVVRVPAIADRAHAIEELVGPYRDAPAALPREHVSAILAHLDAIAGAVAAIDAPAASPAAPPGVPPGPPAAVPAEAIAPTVRAELSEMDELLDGVVETHKLVRDVRTAARGLEGARRLAELVVAQLGSAAAPDKARALAGELRDQLQRQERALETGLERVDRELAQVREAAEHIRLVAVESAFSVLERTSRDAALALGKRVTFEARGGRVRIDAGVLAALQGALVQLVRNAVAHGIEEPAARIRAGKPPAGRVAIEVVRRGRRVAITCRDDGAGLDREALRSAAQRRGIALARDADPAELVRVLSRGGLSTATAVTEVAGRGIGLDVVRAVIEQLGAELVVDSEPGRGTGFELVVPVSLASLDVLLAEAEGSVVAIPLDAVRATRRLGDGEIVRTAHTETVVVDDRPIPFIPLAAVVRPGEPPAERPARVIGVIVTGGANGDAAIGVDRLRGAATVVVRPIHAHAQADAVIAGAYLDASGDPQLVLDPEHVVRAARARVPVDAPRRTRHAVLVIDDSLTTRMLEQSILESAGYEVDTAISGEQGLEAARRKRYALFLVDVEMPGIDGFTFIERLRADPELRDTPAILVTSRDSAADRARGIAAGAQGYIVKGELDQTDLLARIDRMVRAA